MPAEDPEAAHARISAIIERLMPGEVLKLQPGKFRYSLLLNEQGGIIDDFLVGRPRHPGRQGSLAVVVNAGTKDNDFALMESVAGDEGPRPPPHDKAPLAPPGPQAAPGDPRLPPGAPRPALLEPRRQPYQ